MPLLTKKSSFLVNFVASVIALCALNPKNVVDAAPRERKTKKTKKEKSDKGGGGGGGVRGLKCSKGGKKTKKKANAKYEYLGDQVDLRYRGMYLLLDPPVDQLVALERFDTGDESCPEQVVSTCMETCEGTTDCTAFHVFNGLPWDVDERANDDSGANQWYCIGVNGLLEGTPITKSTAQPEVQRSYISYTLTSALAEQGIPDYVAANLTEGSSEHNAYFVPAFGCVATQGFTTVTPDYVAAQACEACLNSVTSVIGTCDETAAAICARDGGILGTNAMLLPGGTEDCNGKCGPEVCYDLIRVASLALAGGPITQCPVRDIYDAGLGRDLKPYTCPWMDQTIV